MVLADGVSKPLLDIDETVAVFVVDWAGVFDAMPFLDGYDEGGGDFPLRNCLGVLRNFKPGVRPRRCLSEGLGESAGSAVCRSDSFERPENERPVFL